MAVIFSLLCTFSDLRVREIRVVEDQSIRANAVAEPPSPFGASDNHSHQHALQHETRPLLDLRR